MKVKNVSETKSVVRLAIEPDANQKKQITAFVVSKGGSEQAISYIVDPTVLGGVQIRVGDYLLDATLSHQLTEMLASLKENN